MKVYGEYEKLILELDKEIVDESIIIKLENASEGSYKLWVQLDDGDLEERIYRISDKIKTVTKDDTGRSGFNLVFNSTKLAFRSGRKIPVQASEDLINNYIEYFTNRSGQFQYMKLNEHNLSDKDIIDKFAVTYTHGTTLEGVV